METLLSSLVGFGAWLLKTSFQASVVIGLVLLAQWLFKKWLSPRWRYCLWALVLIRLMLPLSPESAFSIFNYTQGVKFLARGTHASEAPGLPGAQATPSITARPSNLDKQGAVSSNANASSASHDPGARTALSAQIPSADQEKADKAVRAPILSDSTTQLVAPTTLPPVPNRAPNLQQAQTADQPVIGAPTKPNQIETSRSSPEKRQSSASATHRSWPPVLSLLWLGGVLFLLTRIIWFPLRLNAQLAQHETATGPDVFEILEQSKRLIGVNRVLPIIQSRAVTSPALLGFIRPWLLLPVGMVERFTPQELRFVFLHELAHLKRRDIAVNWLMTILQILHWFNPLVWFAFSRMRADRELACDELALSFAKADENKSYGQAIIKLLEGFTRPTVLPGLVGILEDKQQMKRRITSIAQFKQMTQWSPAAVGLILVVGCVTLTDAQREKNTGRASTPVRSAATKVLFSGTGADAGGVLAPDESTIAYVDCGDDGSGENLTLRDLRTGETKRLTSSGSQRRYEYAIDPVWSPDSKSIVYGWETDDDTIPASLRIVSRDGGEPRIIRSVAHDEFYPYDWSRDGKLLVGNWETYGPAAKPGRLATIDVATGELRPLGPKGVHERFSPDSRFVVFERTVGGNRDVFVVSVDGGTTGRITDSPAEDGSPVFSADGRFVLFSSNLSGTWALWAIAVENGRSVGTAFPVKYDFGDHHKRTTATGKLAFSSGGAIQDVYEIVATRSVGQAESQPKALAKASFGRNYAPAWSPDGQKVAYIRSGRFEWGSVQRDLVCVQSLADGVELTYETGLSFFNWLFWSRDGQTLALLGFEEGRDIRGIYLFSLTTRQRDPVPIMAGFPVGFSSNGQEFVFINDRKERVAVNLATRTQRIIPFLKALAHHEYDVTTDEASVVYVEEQPAESQLVVSNADSRNRRVITRVQKPERIWSPRWSPDGTKIAYYAFQKVHVCAADGSWDRIVNTGNKYVHLLTHGPSWSADSTKLAVTLHEVMVSEIGVLENFLPKQTVATR